MTTLNPLGLAGPLFLGSCYCLGAGVDILMDEGDRYAKLRMKEAKQRSMDADSTRLLN